MQRHSRGGVEPGDSYFPASSDLEVQRRPDGDTEGNATLSNITKAQKRAMRLFPSTAVAEASHTDPALWQRTRPATVGAVPRSAFSSGTRHSAAAATKLGASSNDNHKKGVATTGRGQQQAGAAASSMKTHSTQQRPTDVTAPGKLTHADKNTTADIETELMDRIAELNSTSVDLEEVNKANAVVSEGKGVTIADPAQTGKEQSRAYTDYGIIKLEEGDYKSALALFNRALDCDPTNPDAREARIQTYLSIRTDESFENALKDAEHTIHSCPEEPHGYYWKGVICREKKQYSEAERNLRQAELLTPVSRRSRISSAQGELAKQRLESCAKAYEPEDDDSQKSREIKDEDKFERLERWLSNDPDKNTNFPILEMKKYEEGNRGVHVRHDVEPESEIMSIDLKYLITVEMGQQDCEIGRKVYMADPPLRLSASKHCYTAIFILCDMENEDSFFQPYYKILPQSYPNMPIFWGENELAYLRGSFLLEQIEDRKRNMEADYQEIAKIAPEFRRFSLNDFMWARMVVASRNFGICVDGRRTDAMVPYADMLNHYRPRETKWTFDSSRRCFTISAISQLQGGQQVYDSYGKKCNSRFLLNYGFAVEHNRDDDTGENHNEVRLIFDLLSPEDDPLYLEKLEMLEGTPSARAIRISMFYEHDGTNEAFSYLRFVHANANELSQLPRSIASCNLRRNCILPFSIRNERDVLEHLAFLCQKQLDDYPTSLDEDVALLGSGELEFGSNRRNCTIVIKGEKEVCHYYIELYREVCDLVDMERQNAIQCIHAVYCGDDDIDKYMRNVLLPLLEARQPI